MIWLIGSVLYALIGIAVACRVASTVAWKGTFSRWERDRRDYPSLYGHKPMPTEVRDWFDASWAGIGTFFVWPLIVVLAAFSTRLFAPPKQVRARQMRERIAQLEKELEVTP